MTKSRPRSTEKADCNAVGVLRMKAGLLQLAGPKPLAFWAMRSAQEPAGMS